MSPLMAISIQAEIRGAIANAMGCAPQDLLGENAPFLDKQPSNRGFAPLEHADILLRSLSCILETSKDKSFSLTLHQTLRILEKSYQYAVQKNPPQVDQDFIEWFIRKTIS